MEDPSGKTAAEGEMGEENERSEKVPDGDGTGDYGLMRRGNLVKAECLL